MHHLDDLVVLQQSFGPPQHARIIGSRSDLKGAFAERVQRRQVVLRALVQVHRTRKEASKVNKRQVAEAIIE